MPREERAKSLSHLFIRWAVFCLAASLLTACPAVQPIAPAATTLPLRQVSPTKAPPTQAPSPPTLAPTAATIVRLDDPCRFLTVAEVEAVYGGPLVAQPVKSQSALGVACRYQTADKDGNVRLVVGVITDADLAAKGKTAGEWFASVQGGEKLMATRLPKTIVEDLSGPGEQAYYRESSMLVVSVLSGGVVYDLSTITPEFGGKGSKEALLNFAHLVVQRAP